MNALVPTDEAVPTTTFNPAFSEIFAAAILLTSSVLSVVTSILTKVSAETETTPFTGEIERVAGPGHKAFAASSVAAVLMVPLGQVIVTVMGAGGVLLPPPPHATSTKVIKATTHMLKMFLFMMPVFGVEVQFVDPSVLLMRLERGLGSERC